MPDRPARIGNFRYSAAHFLGALILLLLAIPFLDGTVCGPAIDFLLFTLVLTMGVLAVGRSHRTLVVAILLMVPAVLICWLCRFQPDWLPYRSAGETVFIGFVEFEFLRFIFRASRVNSEVLCADISGYLLLGTLWTSCYLMVSRIDSHAFAFNLGTPSLVTLKPFDAYHFSFITLNTVDYGDITPFSHAARALAMAEAMPGHLHGGIDFPSGGAVYVPRFGFQGAND